MEKQIHSHSYHRYFENYAEREVITPDGGRRIERVYVGQYYIVDLPDSEHKRLRLRVAGLAAFILVAFLIAAFRATASAFVFGAVGTMAALIALLFLIISVTFRLTVPREMEIRSYRDSSENLITRSLITAVCLAVCAAATFFSALYIESFSLSENLLSVILYLAAAGASLVLHCMEKKTPYRKLAPKKERPELSSPIRYEAPDSK